MTYLTSKELNYLSENLKMEILLVKKYKFFSQNVQNTNIRTKLEEAAAKHQYHIDKLLICLK